MIVSKVHPGAAAIISILFGVLAGTAGAADFKQIRVPFEGQLDDIAVADLNGDRYADIVTIDKKAKTITVFMGSADLTFSRHLVRTYANLGSFIIGIADFTGDKKLDVAVDDVLDKTYFAVFPGDGTGNLRTPKKVNTSLANEPNLSHAAVVDFNNDRRPDIVGLPEIFNSGFALAFKNLGGGKFGKAWLVDNIFWPAYYGLTAGDFNSDGQADILCSGGGKTRLYLGDGTGAFTSGPFLNDGGFGKLGQEDFNKDKKLDIISGSWGRGWTYLGKGNGRFGAKKYLSGRSGYSSGIENDFAVANLTGDNKPDVAEPVYGGILIHPGKGTGGFGPWFMIGPGLKFIHNKYFNGGSNIAAGDFDKDGKTDLAGVHCDGDDGRSPVMTDLMLFVTGRPPVTLTIANLNVTNLSYMGGAVLFAGNFTFQTNGGDLKYPAAPAITDNAYLEFKVKLDFQYPLSDYTYTYIATGTFLNLPGQTSGLVSFNLALPTTIVTTATPTVTLSDFILRDYNLVPSNELLSASSRMKGDAVIGVRADR